MRHSSTLYELIQQVPDSQRIEVIERLPRTGKMRALLNHIHTLVVEHDSYSHAGGVRAVYGLTQREPDYRKAYIAYLRLCDVLEQRLRKLWRGDEEDPALDVLELTPSERLYFRARTLWSHGSVDGARSLLLEAHRRSASDNTCESTRLAIAALYIRSLLNDQRDSKKVVREIPNLVARSIVEALYHHGIYSSSAMQNGKKRNPTAALEPYKEIATVGLMRDHAPALELMASWHSANAEEMQGNSNAARTIRSNSAEAARRSVEQNYSFLRGSVEPTTGLELRTLYGSALTALSEDRLEDGLELLTIAAGFAHEHSLHYEAPQSMRIQALFALNRLHELPEQIEALRSYSEQQSLPLEAAKAAYFKAWLDLYGRRIGKRSGIIEALTAYENYVEKKPDLLWDVITLKSMYYFRIGDAEGVEATLAQLQGRGCAQHGARRSYKLQQAMLEVLEQRRAPTRRRRGTVDQLLHALITVGPGQRYRRGATAEWTRRFMSVEG